MASKKRGNTARARGATTSRKADSLKEQKARLVAEIFALKAESASIAEQLTRAGFNDYVKCW